MSKKKSKKYADIHSFLNDFDTSAQRNQYLYDMKDRLKGIHHQVSKEYIARYLCAHNYRLNNRNHTGAYFLRRLKNMMKMPPLPRQMAIGE